MIASLVCQLGGSEVGKSGSWKVGVKDFRTSPLPNFPTSSQAQFFDSDLFVFVNRRVIRETHNLKRLVDDRRQAAEGDLAALVHHLLDDLDEDADADRVDDLRFAQVEQKRLHSAV